MRPEYWRLVNRATYAFMGFGLLCVMLAGTKPASAKYGIAFGLGLSLGAMGLSLTLRFLLPQRATEMQFSSKERTQSRTKLRAASESSFGEANPLAPVVEAHSKVEPLAPASEAALAPESSPLDRANLDFLDELNYLYRPSFGKATRPKAASEPVKPAEEPKPLPKDFEKYF